MGAVGRPRMSTAYAQLETFCSEVGVDFDRATIDSLNTRASDLSLVREVKRYKLDSSWEAVAKLTPYQGGMYGNSTKSMSSESVESELWDIADDEHIQQTLAKRNEYLKKILDELRTAAGSRPTVRAGQAWESSALAQAGSVASGASFQLVGLTCAHCDKRIVVQADGAVCNSCHCAFHGSCLQADGRCPACA